MKRLLTIVLALAVYSSCVSGQQNDKIALIRQTVTAINTQINYKVKTLDNDYFEDKYGETPDNGIELKGYYKNGVLKKMVYSVGLSNSMNIYEFYLSGPNLVFVFFKEADYPYTAGGMDYSRLVPAMEGRYYFDEGKIFKTIIKGKGRGNGLQPPDFLSNFNDLKKYLAGYKGK